MVFITTNLVQFVLVVTGWDVRVCIENESGGFSAADIIKSEKKLTILISPMFLHGATRCIWYFILKCRTVLIVTCHI